MFEPLITQANVQDCELTSEICKEEVPIPRQGIVGCVVVYGSHPATWNKFLNQKM